MTEVVREHRILKVEGLVLIDDLEMGFVCGDT